MTDTLNALIDRLTRYRDHLQKSVPGIITDEYPLEIVALLDGGCVCSAVRIESLELKITECVAPGILLRLVEVI